MKLQDLLKKMKPKTNFWLGIYQWNFRFIGAALIRGRRLKEGGAYIEKKDFRCGAYWRAALKRGRRLLEEIR